MPVKQKQAIPQIIVFWWHFILLDMTRIWDYICVYCGSSYREKLVATIEHIIAGGLTEIVCSQEPRRIVALFTNVSILGATLGATLGGDFGR